MALSVVAIVFVLVAAVAGWTVNTTDFTIEQNGLISFKTNPTDAMVFIDEKRERSLTNFQRLLSGGEHKVVIQKDGYEHWEKTVKITPGWLLRLEYPRLFKQNREKEVVDSYPELNYFYVSPDRNIAFYSVDKTGDIYLATNFNAAPRTTHISIKKLLSGVEGDEVNFKIDEVKWNRNNTKFLVHFVNEKPDKNSNAYIDSQWVVLSIRDESENVNITSTYQKYEKNSKTVVSKASSNDAKIITDIDFDDNAGDKVLILAKDELIRIDLNNKSVSSPILNNISKFVRRDTHLVYLTNANDKGKKTIEILRDGDKKSSIVKTLDKKDNTTFALTRFNSKNYIVFTVNNRIYSYRGDDYPANGGNIKSMELVVEADTTTNPTSAMVSANKEFIVFRTGTKVMVYDTELELYHEYDYEDEKTRFLESHIMYRADKETGNLLAWDFDGTNVRTLVVDNALNDYDAFISSNGKYLYYFKSSPDFKAVLMREKL